MSCGANFLIKCAKKFLFFFNLLLNRWLLPWWWAEQSFQMRENNSNDASLHTLIKVFSGFFLPLDYHRTPRRVRTLVCVCVWILQPLNLPCLPNSANNRAMARKRERKTKHSTFLWSQCGQNALARSLARSRARVAPARLQRESNVRAREHVEVTQEFRGRENTQRFWYWLHKHTHTHTLAGYTSALWLARGKPEGPKITWKLIAPEHLVRRRSKLAAR